MIAESDKSDRMKRERQSDSSDSWFKKNRGIKSIVTVIVGRGESVSHCDRTPLPIMKTEKE